MGSGELGDDASPYLAGAPASAKTRNRRRATFAGAVAVVAVVGIVAAMMASNDGPHPVVTGVEVYNATVRANSAVTTSVSSFITGNRAKVITVTASGPFSWVTDQGASTSTTTASGSFATTIREIFDKNVTYSKVSNPQVPVHVATNIPWLTGWTETISTGPSQQSAWELLSQGFFGLVGASSGQDNPTTILRLLRAEASSVTKLGRQVLDGITTTHYRAHIPLARLGTGSATELRQAEQLLGFDSLGVDYWIDSSHLLRQVYFAITIPRGPDTPTTTVPGEFAATVKYPITWSVRLRLADYGVRVHVVPPPASQITYVQHCVTTADAVNCQ